MIPELTYQSYLVRFWRDSPQTAWRATAQSTADGNKYHFTDVAELVNFLIIRLANESPATESLVNETQASAQTSLCSVNDSRAS
jgi:hypothetical protein